MPSRSEVQIAANRESCQGSPRLPYSHRTRAQEHPLYLVLPYWEVGPIGPIQPWGFFVALGVVIGLIIGHHRAKALGLSTDRFGNLAAWILVGGFVGARLAHVFLYHWDDYRDNWAEIPAMWKGGMSSYGGFVGATLAGIAYIRRSNIDFWHYADVASYGFVPGWAIGRIGCFAIHDHPGSISHSPLAVYMKVGIPDEVTGKLIYRIDPRHDLGLYDGILTAFIWAFFIIANRQPRKAGFYLGWMCVFYSIPRYFLDTLRAVDIDHADTRYLGLTPAQYGSIILAGLGGSILWQQRFRDQSPV